MTTVTTQDLKACRLCAKGSRRWFEYHGLDWAGFVRDGIPAEAMLATGDSQVLQVVEAAERREQGAEQ